MAQSTTAPASAPTTQLTPYTSHDKSFTVSLPAGWVKVTAAGMELAVVEHLAKPGEQRASISITVLHDMPEGSRARYFMRALLQDSPKEIKVMEVLDQSPITLSGAPAWEAHFQARVADRAIAEMLEEVLIIDRTAYVLLFTASPAEYDRQRPTFDAVKKSLAVNASARPLATQPSTRPTSAPSIEMLVYTARDNSFKISYPRDWQIAKKTVSLLARIHSKPDPNRDGASVGVGRFRPIEAGTTARQTIQTAVAQMKAIKRDFKVLKEGPSKLGGYEGWEATYEDEDCWGKLVVVTVGNWRVNFVFACGIEEFDKFAPILTAMEASVSFPK